MSDRKLLAVTGRPILHSLSPHIFNRLYREMGMNGCYLRISAESAAEAMATARAIGIKGLNITSPLKEKMVSALNTMDTHSRTIQAVNCLALEPQQNRGYNTDFIGAVHALKRNGADPKNRRIAVLGAGGAARAAAYGLLRAHAQKVTLLNRNPEKAKKISARLGCEHALLEDSDKVFAECDILISCLLSNERIVNPDHIHGNLTVMDASYKQSFLIENAKLKGCRTINGHDWLVHQAIPAFGLLTQRKIPKILREILEENFCGDEIIRKPNIALVGFMGAGKTEVGKLLAEKMGYGFADTDVLIQKIAGISIPEMFNSWGESSFRALESSVIRKFIQDSQRYVFSLGGGAVLDRENVRIIKERCHVVWLWASGPTIQSRVCPAHRPLFPTNGHLEQIEKMLHERIPFYSRASDFVINNDLNDTARTADRIKYEMDQAFEN